MGIEDRLQQLEELVREAKSLPLSSSARIEREEVLEIIEGAREELPDEIKQARWIVKDREELLGKARHDAELIVDKARAEQARLVAAEEVVRAAGEEAERVLAEANQRARELRLEAEDYVDAKLAEFEIALDKTRQAIDRSISQVQRGRERLRGAPVTPAEEEFGGRQVFDEEEA